MPKGKGYQGGTKSRGNSRSKNSRPVTKAKRGTKKSTTLRKKPVRGRGPMPRQMKGY